MIQLCSGIASGRVLNGELYAQRLQKLISQWRALCKLTSVNFVV